MLWSVRPQNCFGGERFQGGGTESSVSLLEIESMIRAASRGTSTLGAGDTFLVERR